MTVWLKSNAVVALIFVLSITFVSAHAEAERFFRSREERAWARAEEEYAQELRVQELRDRRERANAIYQQMDREFVEFNRPYVDAIIQRYMPQPPQQPARPVSRRERIQNLCSAWYPPFSDRCVSESIRVGASAQRVETCLSIFQYADEDWNRAGIECIVVGHTANTSPQAVATCRNEVFGRGYSDIKLNGEQFRLCQLRHSRSRSAPKKQ